MLAAFLTFFLLSLAGIPPLAGFIGKFFVFSSAIQGGFRTLAIIAAINSAVAAFYYFKIVRVMYLASPLHEEEIKTPFSLTFALFILVASVLIVGLFPSPFISFAKASLLF
jgi:NADH:ubiquinone oxidoreductase subunit 2 (subunit N)